MSLWDRLNGPTGARIVRNVTFALVLYIAVVVSGDCLGKAP